MSIPLNNFLPRDILTALDVESAILYCSAETDGIVQVTTSMMPANLQPLDSLCALDGQSLNQARLACQVHAITVTLMKLTENLIPQIGAGYPDGMQIEAELRDLLQKKRDVYVTYVITHYNSRPADDLTVAVGGDCYRDQDTLAAVFDRTAALAKAMIRKAVLIFPDIPVLHGGKKGEWIVTDAAGMKIAAISGETLAALGAFIIPQGILFCNRRKEQQGRSRKSFRQFPAQNVIRPDTASPDVLSGKFWAQMCTTWQQRGFDSSYMTCLPPQLGGPQFNSAYPTGYGLANTTVELIKGYSPDKPLPEIRFLLAALGNVGRNTIKVLTQDFGVPPQNIVAFDPTASACDTARTEYGLTNVYQLSNHSFYADVLPQMEFDVWVNNGMGDDTTPQQIERLLQSGVWLFCGAANNFLEVKTAPQSLSKIFDAGAWAWPDEAASGGGWTLAVIDLYRRCQGLRADDLETGELILNTIATRNRNLVRAVLDGSSGAKPTGQAVWQRVNQLIADRVEQTTAGSLPAEALLEQADVRNWPI